MAYWDPISAEVSPSSLAIKGIKSDTAKVCPGDVNPAVRAPKAKSSLFFEIKLSTLLFLIDGLGDLMPTKIFSASPVHQIRGNPYCLLFEGPFGVKNRAGKA